MRISFSSQVSDTSIGPFDNWMFPMPSLHGSLLKEEYVERLCGFIDSNFPHHVCKLHKALYSLKQAPRAWFAHLSQSLVHLEFLESLAS